MKEPGIKMYLVAALLGNVPVMFLVFLLTFPELTVLNNYPLLIQASFFSLMFLGAASAGYLIVRRFPTRPSVLGLTTGALSYVINTLYAVILYRDFMALGGYWPLLAFVSGGVIGSQLRELVRKRRRRPPRG